jgi:hypothetical protein
MKPNLTNPELLALRANIESDPASLNTEVGSIYRFNKLARRNLDKIDRAITQNMADARKAAGNPVPCDGYSGRQSNRR